MWRLQYRLLDSSTFTALARTIRRLVEGNLISVDTHHELHDNNGKKRRLERAGSQKGLGIMRNIARVSPILFTHSIKNDDELCHDGHNLDI